MRTTRAERRTAVEWVRQEWSRVVELRRGTCEFNEIASNWFYFILAFLCPKNRINLDNQQRLRSPKGQGATPLVESDVKSSQDDTKYLNRMDIYSDSNENAIKINDEATSEDDRPPRLPPRPPPRPRNTMNSEAGMIYSCRFSTMLNDVPLTE